MKTRAQILLRGSLAAFALAGVLSMNVLAQDQQTPSQQSSQSTQTTQSTQTSQDTQTAQTTQPAADMSYETQPGKWQVFAGYAWRDPGDVLFGNPLDGIAKGFNTQVSYFFNRYGGLTLDASGHWGEDSNIGQIMFGPTVRVPMENSALFFHAMGGWHRLAPEGFEAKSALGAMVGAGFDLNITRNVAWRVIQGDFVYASHDFERGTSVDQLNLQGGRVASGLVFNWGGGPPPPPPAVSCSASPTEVFDGEPVTVTCSPSGFNPKRTLTWNWTPQGGKISGEATGSTVQIDTTGQAPGDYRVNANVTDGRKATAQGTVSYRVKERPKNPPAMTCSAAPTTVQTGNPATVTCECTSPDQRPVTINFNTSAGRITPSGNTAQLDTAGAEPGTINITATCTDDRGLNVTAPATVTVEAPPPPPAPAPEASQINTCDSYKRNNARVDNACKGALDDVAQRLQRDPDSKVVVVGNFDAATEKRNGQSLAAQRARNVKAYLTTGEGKAGIDPTRIELRTGSNSGTTTEHWIVPAGAEFRQEGTQPVADRPSPTRRR